MAATRRRTPLRPRREEDSAAAAVPRMRLYPRQRQPLHALITATMIATIPLMIATQSLTFESLGGFTESEAFVSDTTDFVFTASSNATRNVPVTFSMSSFAKTSLMNGNRPLRLRADVSP